MPALPHPPAYNVEEYEGRFDKDNMRHDANYGAPQCEPFTGLSGTLFGMREAGLTLDKFPGSEPDDDDDDGLADGYVAGPPHHPHPQPHVCSPQAG